MKRVALKTVQSRLSDYVEHSAEQPIVILRDGEPVAMLVGIKSAPKRKPVPLREVLRKAWKDYEVHGGTPHEEFWEELANDTSLAKKKRAKVK
jgi:antitoxin (DNA-binding transcriptional repressor) of toxin-antitoxin stability system